MVFQIKWTVCRLIPILGDHLRVQIGDRLRADDWVACAERLARLEAGGNGPRGLGMQ